MSEMADVRGGFRWDHEFRTVSSLSKADASMPVFGDAAFEYHAQGYQWFTVAHPINGKGKNSYDNPDRDVPRAFTPEGFQQANADGSAKWIDLDDMERAMYTNWGPVSYQWLNWE